MCNMSRHPRLVQPELPVLPNVGDRLLENLNTENTNLPILIREGIFIESFERYGKILWKVKRKDEVTNFDPEFRAAVGR